MFLCFLRTACVLGCMLLFQFVAHAQISRTTLLPNGLQYEYNQHLTPDSGYVFLGSCKLLSSINYTATLIIMDNDGVPAYFKNRAIDEGSTLDFRMYDNGLMSYLSQDSSGKVQYYILDSTFTIIDSVSCSNGLKIDGHELLILPNGNYLTLCLDERIMDLSNITTYDGFQGDVDARVIGYSIQEISPAKNLLFEWNGFDHYTLADVDVNFFQSPDYLEFGHPNSLFVDSNDNIIMSLRHFNEVVKINKQTSAIMWRLGGKGNQFTFVNDSPPFFNMQHHAVLLPNGNLTLFDNGRLSDPFLARGVEYALDQSNMIATLVWQHTNIPGIEDFAFGSMQRLNNGNNLIGWGVTFTTPFDNDVEEVDSADNSVWELDWPDGYFTYRAYKKSPTWNLEKLRPTITCDTVAGTTTLTASGNNSTYLWNTGDTTKTIIITAPGEYYVLASANNEEDYFGSRIKVITDMLNPCQKDTSTYTALVSLPTFQMYPNPASHSILVNNINSVTGTELVFYNMMGEAVGIHALSLGSTSISVETMPNGSYIAIVTTPDHNQLQRFKVIVAH